MIEILLYTSIVLVLSGYGLYFLLIFIGRMNNVGECNGFDVTKDIISEYNSINVIENRGYFTVYNIKRKVIKIASACYYGNHVSSLSLSLMEAGISIVDNNKNKYIDMLRNIFSNLKILYIFPLVAMFINGSSFNINDAKIGIILILCFSCISYIILDIKTMAYNFICDNIRNIDSINEKNKIKIVSFMNRFLLCDKMIFFGELLMIVRLLFIMFNL